jgi:hypothetical protein
MTVAHCCWKLFSPGLYTRLLLGCLAGALALALLARLVFQLPVSLVAIGAVAALLPYLLVKFRADSSSFGFSFALLQLLVVAQLGHFVEHSAQVYQIHVLGWPPKLAGGIISQLNSEIVHFIWNVSVVGVSIWLFALGVRGGLMLLNIGWALLHTGEHIYMLRNYILSGGEQGLPGILGKGGWLSQAPITQGSFICTLPVATTWIRPDIHFLWNLVEVILLLLAFTAYVRANEGQIRSAAERQAPAPAALPDAA